MKRKFDDDKMMVTTAQTMDEQGRPIPGVVTGVEYFLEVLRNECVKEIEVINMYPFRQLLQSCREGHVFFFTEDWCPPGIHQRTDRIEGERCQEPHIRPSLSRATIFG